MISADHVTKRFGRCKAVDDLSFEVATGEALALWGANGAGKTTAIRCLLGLLPFRGAITVDGHDIRREGKAARRAIGYVPQELALYDDFRLTEALHFFARLKRADRRRAPIVLDEVGLVDHRKKRIRELSGGMKQRMALAVALLADPPVLVLDELTSNLDATAQGGFMSLLRRLKQDGKTILFTSHHLGEVEALADRVLVMVSGSSKLTCRPDELAESVGAHSLLKVFIEPDALDDALRVLLEQGFDATRNGRALNVRVPSTRKAGPLRALSQADIEVRDFDVAAASAGETKPGDLHLD